ncbi:MAG TPA: TonB-dependent receptor [Burkholderiaceae bacterium]|nr:TonB-dependent receptor [Burkholderiaceae bacterium]
MNAAWRAASRAAGAIAAACVYAPFAHAQASPETLERVEIQATRIPTPLAQATDAVTVIARSAIEQADAASGIDLLRQVPGLQIDQVSGAGGLSSVYIRGSDPNHVLVLIDGVRVNDSTNSRGGGYDMSNLDPTRIERIEVFRGAGSSIYGADAMGGVINITTRKAEPGTVNADASAGVGGLGYHAASARVAGANDRLNGSLAASHLQDGLDSRGGSLALDHVGASGGIDFGAGLGLSTSVEHSQRHGTTFPDDSGGELLAVRRALERKADHDTGASVGGHWDLESLSLHALASSYSHQASDDSPGVAPGLRSFVGVPASASTTDYQQRGLSADVLVRVSSQSSLVVGAEVQRETGVATSTYTLFGRSIPADFDLARNTRSEFAEAKWIPVTDLVLRGGVRHDAVDGAGSHVSPSAGARYELHALQASIRADYSSGFKPPSFFSLGLPVPLGGNPNLRPERGAGESIGYEQRLWQGKARAEVDLFRSKYNDLVTFDNQTNRIVNADRVEIRGAELLLSARVSEALSVELSYTRLYTHVNDENAPLRQRPGQRGGIVASWSDGGASTFGWRMEYAAQDFDSSVPTGDEYLPVYLRNDLTYAYRWRYGLRLTAAVDNVFDRQNENYIGQPGQGRRFRVGVEARY